MGHWWSSSNSPMCTLGVSSVRTTVPLPGTMLLSAEDHCWCCSLPFLECHSSSSSPSSIGSFYSSHQEARTGIQDLVFVLVNKPHKCLNLRLANNRQWVNSRWMMNPRLMISEAKPFMLPPTPTFVCFLYETLLSAMYFVLERTSQVAGVQSLVTQTLWWWQSHFQLVWARYCVYLKLCT